MMDVLEEIQCSYVVGCDYQYGQDLWCEFGVYFLLWQFDLFVVEVRCQCIGCVGYGLYSVLWGYVVGFVWEFNEMCFCYVV